MSRAPSRRTSSPAEGGRARLGAEHLGGGRTRFLVWAPFVERVELVILPDRREPMQALEDGYHLAEVDGAGPGTRYRYRLDGELERPDPASRSQPQGVHGPSEVVERLEGSQQGWEGLPLEDYVLYELHVGTFSAEGTFDGAVAGLDRLADLGITAVELMPVAQFPGERNWGYDGVYPFAVQGSYGGRAGLRRLVDACHGRGLAVVLDVVYNHLGPEGNYLADFGPYFTDRYRTPWGAAINFDGPGSDHVRRFFVENAVSWIEDFGVDALRLDAVHAIYDQSARPFLSELAEAVHARAGELGRRCHVTAEDHRNDPRLLRRADAGGMGIDAGWNDDFHHALHVLLTGERDGYYQDFHGLDDLATAFREGFVLSGRHSPYRGHRVGASSRDLPGSRQIVFAQNHDHVGNRPRGERLAELVPFEALKLTAAALLLAPYLPLLFMGEEYGERAPFLYFVDHSDPGLLEAVRAGRMEELAGVSLDGTPPDPGAPETFARSKLDPSLAAAPGHRSILGLHRELLRLRREVEALRTLDKDRQEVRRHGDEVLAVRRWAPDGGQALGLLNFGGADARVTTDLPEGPWSLALDSADRRWEGPGSRLPEGFQTRLEATLTGYGVGLYLQPPRSRPRP